MNRNTKIISGIVALALVAGGFGIYKTTGGNVKLKITPTPVKADSSFVFTKQNYPKVDSATAMFPLATEITKSVLNISDDEAKKMVLSSKTPEAYKNLINGNVDIIFLFGPSDEEIEQARQKGFELEKTTIGKDGFVFINNKENPVKSLTQGQLRDIYQGKIINWNQVGGASAPIMAYQRPKNSGSQTLMEDFMGNTPLMSAPTERIESEMAGLVDVVANFKTAQNTLGYSVYYYANEMYSNPNINFLKVDGIAPSKETIKDGSYPLTKDVYAVIRSTEPKDSPARKLIEWVLTSKGQEAVEKGGYVRVK